MSAAIERAAEALKDFDYNQTKHLGTLAILSKYDHEIYARIVLEALLDDENKLGTVVTVALRDQRQKGPASRSDYDLTVAVLAALRRYWLGEEQ